MLQEEMWEAVKEQLCRSELSLYTVSFEVALWSKGFKSLRQFNDPGPASVSFIQ